MYESACCDWRLQAGLEIGGKWREGGFLKVIPTVGKITSKGEDRQSGKGGRISKGHPYCNTSYSVI
jgi:hypothetical protein